MNSLNVHTEYKQRLTSNDRPVSMFQCQIGWVVSSPVVVPSWSGSGPVESGLGGEELEVRF